ncbi:MAG: sigma-70 family RNA polymerase sigma factor [Candidatus Paceibacterota bacterium]
MVSLDKNDNQEDILPDLVTKHSKSVYRFVFGMVSDESVAEDLTQDIFVKVWKKLKSYNPKYSFNTWLFTIARNTTIDYLRKRKDLVFSDFDRPDDSNMILDTLTDETVLADEVFAHAQDLHKLRAVLGKMPALYKEILVLRYSDDLSLEEIATILKRPIETVKSQHRRGLLHLKELFTRIN